MPDDAARCIAGSHGNVVPRADITHQTKRGALLSFCQGRAIIPRRVHMLDTDGLHVEIYAQWKIGSMPRFQTAVSRRSVFLKHALDDCPILAYNVVRRGHSSIVGRKVRYVLCTPARCCFMNYEPFM